MEQISVVLLDKFQNLEANSAAQKGNVVLSRVKLHWSLQLEDEFSISRVVLPC